VISILEELSILGVVDPNLQDTRKLQQTLWVLA
jgi:hypothetical protein